MPNVPFKNITSLISTKQESISIQIVNDSGLTYTLCDRTNLASPTTNYFSSFRLPHEYDKLKTGSTFSLNNPEMQQLNVDKMVISPIPLDKYSELIDGRSVTFVVPQIDTVSTMSAKTIVSSTYSQLTKKQDSPLLGSNIAFLFSDDINLPRTGTTSASAIANPTNLRTTWNEVPFINRPQAHAYSDLSASDINTDTRAWSSVKQAINYIGESYPTTTNQGYNYDIPVGFAVLDKGFMVLTHPDIIDNIPWTSGYTQTTNYTNSGSTSGTTDIYFQGGASVSQLSFTDIDINFKTSVVCLALPAEFVFSTNPSWNLAYNLQELESGTNGFESIQVTEIGLYNMNEELIAIAKVDRPVEKTYTNIITFSLEIDV